MDDFMPPHKKKKTDIPLLEKSSDHPNSNLSENDNVSKLYNLLSGKKPLANSNYKQSV
jgi:hypothetical protein